MRPPIVLAVILAAFAACAQSIPNPCPNAQPVPEQLRLPATLPAGEPVKFEERVLKYLNTLEYRNLGWCEDKWVGANAANVNVTVSLYSQTIPPYFLADRYQTKTPATGRLQYLAGSLGTLAGTNFANWKLLIASAKR